MIKVHGILFVESEDKMGEIVSVKGADLKLDHAPIKSASGNLLGKVTEYSAVFRCITDESCKLGMLAGLVSSAPDRNENILTGGNYLELKYPFVKIKATLMENTALKEGVRAGNLYFGLSGKVLERNGNIIERCIIDSVILGVSSQQKETKVYLEE